MDLNCTFHFSKEKNTTITVGEVFEAHCPLAGPIAVDVNKLKVKMTPPPENTTGGPQSTGKTEGSLPAGGVSAYELVIVKVAKNDENLGLALTSYIVGPKDIPSFIVTDGTNEFTITSRVQFEVQSILKPNEKPEMFGPAAGLTVVIPMVYWILLGSILLVLASSAMVMVRRRWKRKKRLAKLAELEDGSLPIQQFFAVFRKLQRENPIFNIRSTVDTLVTIEPTQTAEELVTIIHQIEKTFKTFVARRFQITRFEYGWSAISKELQNFHEVVYLVMGNDLAEISREFQKVNVSRGTLEGKDVILIAEKSRRWVEKADQLQSAVLAKDSALIKKLRGGK
ncbi:MAG: hypothetical protein JNL11_01995 [Bdellovibrionaceae bacterium]|nr:hypothetical protein [Pseudobdellovibrionaceae bacterium]